MKDIDFLPARFRDRDRLHRARVRRATTFAVLAALVLAAHGGQLVLRRNLVQQLTALAAPFAEATATKARLDRLRSDLAANEHFAALYTYLEHPWPRTQLLVAVTQTMPDHLALTELRIPQPAAPARKPAPPSSDPAANSIPAPARDLQRLREQLESVPGEVFLKGIAVNPAALHSYVASFAGSPLLATAKLESMESLDDDSLPGGTRFELRLLVRPAYGHPGGPTSPASAAAAGNKIAPFSGRETAHTGGTAAEVKSRELPSNRELGADFARPPLTAVQYVSAPARLPAAPANGEEGNTYGDH